MTTTLELNVMKTQWFCQQGEGFCRHVFSSLYSLFFPLLAVCLLTYEALY